MIEVVEHCEGCGLCVPMGEPCMCSEVTVLHGPPPAEIVSTNGNGLNGHGAECVGLHDAALVQGHIECANCG
jgi:hypothetical protein